MKLAKYLTAALLTTVSLAPLTVGQGLYGNPGKDQTTGDLNDQDYWWAKFDADMLERAIQTRQPEGHIAVDLASSIRRLDDLVKKYPKHQEIAKWYARAKEIDSKIDPNANRGTSFTQECPWDEANFAQLWVNLHWAQLAYAQKDYATASSNMQNVRQNYEIMMRPDRMKYYPDDLRKYVIDSKPEADKLSAILKERNGR